MTATDGAGPLEPRWRIGIYPGPQQVRMEEEEDTPEWRPPTRGKVTTTTPDQAVADPIDDPVIRALIEERTLILGKIDWGTLSNEDKLRLLEQTRQFTSTVRGGRSYKFGTENVIYSILIFSGVLIVVLALLTAFADLPKEVTITFVGTVVGGTIATIAQKLGKVGR